MNQRRGAPARVTPADLTAAALISAAFAVLFFLGI